MLVQLIAIYKKGKIKNRFTLECTSIHSHTGQDAVEQNVEQSRKSLKEEAKEVLYSPCTSAQPNPILSCPS